jgi:hypothetical protein
MVNRKIERDESAIEDDQNDEMDDEENLGFNKSRIRRASEGQQLIKGDSKKGHPNDLRCEKCGKGYKHSSCLTKHLSVPAFLYCTLILPQVVRLAGRQGSTCALLLNVKRLLSMLTSGF